METLDKFLQLFFVYLNTQITLKLDIKPQLFNGLRNFLRNSLNDAMIKKDQKRSIVAQFLQNIVNSVEVMSIVGLNDAANFVGSALQKQIDNNLKNRIWKDSEIQAIKDILAKVQNYSGISGKCTSLVRLLKERSSDQSRSIVFVKTPKTARYLVDFLRNDVDVCRICNPEIFVGHAGGSIEGMEWTEEQEPTLALPSCKYRQMFCRKV